MKIICNMLFLNFSTTLWNFRKSFWWNSSFKTFTVKCQETEKFLCYAKEISQGRPQLSKYSKDTYISFPHKPYTGTKLFGSLLKTYGTVFLVQMGNGTVFNFLHFMHTPVGLVSLAIINFLQKNPMKNLKDAWNGWF